MKLLCCRTCRDVFNLVSGEIKSCRCGHARGLYIDELNARFTGKDAVPIGIDNYSFFARLNAKESLGANEIYDSWYGEKQIQCWLIDVGSPGVDTIKRVRSLRQYEPKEADV